MKTCTRCKIIKEETEFYNDRGQKSGLKPQCKICCIETCRNWSRNNPERRKFNVLKSATGVNEEQYNQLLLLQNNRCAICNKTVKDNKKKLGVDHCHDSYMVRGLLCNSCNIGIGNFLDSTQLLDKAIKYLNNPINKDKNMKYKRK